MTGHEGNDRLRCALGDLLTANDLPLKELAQVAGLDVRFDFCGASLRESNLAGQDLSGFNLSGADMTRANLHGCNLTGTNLCDANLSRATLTDARVENANLARSNLRDAKIDGLTCTNTDLEDAILSGIANGVELRTLLELRSRRRIDRAVPRSSFLAEEAWTYLEAMLRTTLVGRVLLDPFVVWAIDESPMNARLVMQVGPPLPNVNGRLDYGGPLVEVARSGQLLSGGGLAEHADSTSARTYIPVTVRGVVAGVLEVGQGKTDIPLEERLDAYCDIASAMGEMWTQWLRSWATQLLPSRLRGLTDATAALEITTFAARWATQASFAATYLGQTTDPSADWTLVAASGTPPAPKLPRALVEAILGRAKPGATDASARITGLSPQLPVRSLAVAPIDSGGQPVGMLLAAARTTAHFTEVDPGLIRALANQAAMVLGPTRLMVHSLDVISAATAELGRFDAITNKACVDLRGDKYLFVACQTIKRSDNVIETVAASGMAEEWIGCARHPIAKEFVLRDIQADVVLSQRGEVISRSEDEGRMDRYLRQEYKHPEFTRVFVPMIILRDKRTGRFVPDASEECRWRTDYRPSRPRKYDYRLVPEWPSHLTGEVIGTFEAAVKRNVGIDPAMALEFSTKATLIARDIYRATLPYLLERILEAGCLAGQADSAMLHFLKRQHGKFVPEIVQGTAMPTPGPQEIGRRGHPPRKHGLGMRVIKKGKPQTLRAAEIRDSNQPIYDEGVRSMLTLPMPLDDDRTALLYLHYGQDRAFVDDEIQFVRSIVDQAASAIRLSVRQDQISERERLWRGVQKTSLALGAVVESFRSETPASENPTAKLLQAVAGNAVNILAADVVIIYEHVKGRTRLQPVWAGRLLKDRALRDEVGPDDIPYRVIRSGEDIFTTDAEKNEILHGREKPGGSFVTREKIRSCAAVRLRRGNDVVGVMFVNYRRMHEFSPAEIALIQLFGSSAAMFLTHMRSIAVPRFRGWLRSRALELLWTRTVKPGWEQYQPQGPLRPSGPGIRSMGLLNKLKSAARERPPSRALGTLGGRVGPAGSQRPAANQAPPPDAPRPN